MDGAVLVREGGVGETLSKLGRGVAEANLKLLQLLERLEESRSPEAGKNFPARFEVLAEVVDAMDRSIRELGREPGEVAARVASGLLLARARVLDALRAEGVVPIRNTGKFLSRVHQVVGTLASAPEGRIGEVVRRGWAGRREGEIFLLRPSLVLVGKKRGDRE